MTKVLSTIWKFLGPRGLAVAGLALAFAFAWWVSSWFDGVTAKTEAKLAENQVEAAIESGREAVKTTNRQAERERAVDALTRENERAIRDAEGADAPVDPAVRDALLTSLCKRAAYREHPECVQQASAAGVGGRR